MIANNITLGWLLVSTITNYMSNHSEFIMKQIILKRVYHDEMNHPISINNIKYQIKI